jgi:hypothetical protein
LRDIEFQMRPIVDIDRRNGRLRDAAQKFGEIGRIAAQGQAAMQLTQPLDPPHDFVGEETVIDDRGAVRLSAIGLSLRFGRRAKGGNRCFS